MVNTVLGRIDEKELGITLCHEHIVCGSPDLKKAFGDRYYRDDQLIDLAVKQITEAKERYGLGTIIDGTPIDIGRDVRVLVEVSKRTGVHIIASTGLYYDARGFMWGKTPEWLAPFFIDECEHGMENTYQTDFPVFPGMLKCATDAEGVTAQNRCYLETMAIVQTKTGLPLFAHNAHAKKTAPDQLEIFQSRGVDLSKVIIGHASDTTDVAYLVSLAKQGVYLGFDRLAPTTEKVETICRLLDLGYTDRILLSRDGAAYMGFGADRFENVVNRKTNNFIEVVGKFADLLREAGVSQAELDAMFITNIQRLFR